MLKKTVFCIFCLSVISLGIFAQNDDDSQNNENQGVTVEIAKEAWGLYVQYRRLTNEVKNYWENEIETGLRDGKYTNNIRLSQYQRIKNIFDRLLTSQYLRRDVNKYNWRIYLQNTNSLNAFAAIDGIIIINKGIVDFCQNDDELAIIIGHEIAHMTEDHVKKQLGARIVKEPIIEHISSFIAQRKNKRLNTEEISDKEISDKEMFQLVFGLAGELALLKYSRSQEEKADEEGAKFAASVGYDTEKGYDLWSRMALNSSNGWSNFLSTHPNSDHRAKEFLNGNYKRKYYRAYTGE
ncbi:M48 family metalloprotease [Leadbettera azotonutricia]|uniref:Peptidase M48, Ste24p n=1 Tax=Leadbettera azotonutricia (strain ATCC BAA-888 / DSM 13862 / ZAS-9) TaxID=545695 RepID=F5YFV1_LEAAZ|nr:M48 family metalloprotease [Leadbettera azotonutricia]AEF83506.1 peptidase M48, Ste24p [Leadbettera azotonutricia ZAS-9]